nr:unnamed protein product [Callosobruchus analis]
MLLEAYRLIMMNCV